MASWTDIPNSSLETGAPARSVDALAFRDNPIAIAEGATGAPRILNAAINDYPFGAEDFQTGTDETAWVVGRYAGVSANQIGSICISATFTAKGGTIAGSLLKYASSVSSFDESFFNYTSLGMSGTWRSLGGSCSYEGFNALLTHQSCLYVRIA